MKLPDDKQQRIKIFIMIGLGVILVLLGLVQGIINPLRTSAADKQARMVESQDGLERARKEIRSAARSLDRRMETLVSIQRISDTYILHPILGNYLLEATSIIEGHSAALEVPIEPVREVAISDIPRDAKSTTERLLKAYTVRVNMVESYHNACRLVREIEDGNPYICVTSLMIRPRASGDVENHNISFEVQWPVWADPDFPTEIEEQLKEQLSKQKAEPA